MRATFLQFKEKIMKFFQKKTQNQDRFKRLIHRLSEMSDTELTKVEKLLDVVFDPSLVNETTDGGGGNTESPQFLAAKAIFDANFWLSAEGKRPFSKGLNRIRYVCSLTCEFTSQD